MFISVQFGYNQTKLFNINCQVAPLLDAINTGAYKEMVNAIKKREEFFNKEIAQFHKKEQNLLKKLEKLEQSEEKEDKKPAPVVEVKGKGKRLTKKEKDELERQLKLQQEEEERKRKEEEEARLKAEEEERKRKEEEEKKAAKDKKGKGKAKKEEEVHEEPAVVTEEMKIAREKAEINQALAALRTEIAKYEDKVKLCQEQALKTQQEGEIEKLIELTEKTGDRKFLRNSSDANASTLLCERKSYVLTQVKKNAQEEEVVEKIVIDGACIRTPEEDIKWAAEQAELEALAAKNTKGKPGAKKK